MEILAPKVCSGCGVCVAGCPKKAINLIRNTNGFFEAQINNEVCVNCGLCLKLCSFAEGLVKKINKPLDAYVYQSARSESIQKSASGGVCNDLAVEMVKNGGVVCGAIFDKLTYSVKHIVTDKYEELQLIQGSKYLQSDLTDALHLLLKNQSKGIIFGTPCQINAINNLLNKKNRRNDFVLVDFSCHGVPSYNVFDKYINYRLKSKKLDGVNFRDKKYGWGRYCVSVTSGDSTDYSTPEEGDFFIRTFLGNMCLNKSCYECPFHSSMSAADIRASDSWGVKAFDNAQGSSAILVSTEKGMRQIECLKESGSLMNIAKESVLGGQLHGKIKRPFLYNFYSRIMKSNLSCKTINRLIVSPNYMVNVVFRGYFNALIRMFFNVKR